MSSLSEQTGEKKLDVRKHVPPNLMLVIVSFSLDPEQEHEWKGFILCNAPVAPLRSRSRDA